MPEPLALCIEDCAQSAAPRYLQCVALVGRGPGLALDSAGEVLWGGAGEALVELWVSADSRLMLYRPEGAGPGRALVHRGGRSLEVPIAKPVVLVDQDELEIGSRRLRLHVHGETEAAAPPRPPDEQRGQAGAGRSVRAAAAALALGAAVSAGACNKPVEVRTEPPAVPVERKPDAARVERKPDAAPRPAPTPDQGQLRIEVRDRPPGAPMRSTEKPPPESAPRGEKPKR